MNKQFEEWFEDHDPYLNKTVQLARQMRAGYETAEFEDYPSSMQWGVYLEFFDSVGIFITAFKRFKANGYYFESGEYSKEASFYSSTSITLEEAQKESIKKAFDILKK